MADLRDNVVNVTRVVAELAHDDGDSGNPQKIGFQARSTLPTAVASADRVNAISDLWGRQMICTIDPAQQIWKSGNYTSAQTGTALWTPASGKKVAITHLQVTSYGTTAGRVILWFGAGGGSPDTTYSEGTDQVVFKASFAPGTNSKPGALPPLPHPIFSATADYVLRITLCAAISLDVVVYGYEF